MELWDHLGEEGVWSPSFSRPFNDLGGGGGGEITFENPG